MSFLGVLHPAGLLDHYGDVTSPAVYDGPQFTLELGHFRRIGDYFEQISTILIMEHNAP